jgi:hypothetical protein
MPIWRREFYQGGQYRATMAKIDRLLVWVEWKAYERFRESEQTSGAIAAMQRVPYQHYRRSR